MAGATLTPKITIRRRLPKSVRVILIAVLVMTAAEVENMAQERKKSLEKNENQASETHILMLERNVI